MDHTIPATPEISRSSSESSIDYEDTPLARVGQKRQLKISTYEELHLFVVELVKILETIFELGVMRGTASRYKMAKRSSDDGD